MKRFTPRTALAGCVVLLTVLFLAPMAGAVDPNSDVWARAIIHGDGSRTVAKKDSNSRIIEAKTYDKDDALVMKRIFQIDAKGNSKRGFIFDGGNNLIYRLGFVYDEIDRLKETVLFDPAGEVVSRKQHSYDAQGREMKPRILNRSGSAPAPGQIRPEAALAAPGSQEAVIVTVQETQAASKKETAEPEKKKRWRLPFFRKKK